MEASDELSGFIKREGAPYVKALGVLEKCLDAVDPEGATVTEDRLRTPFLSLAVSMPAP